MKLYYKEDRACAFIGSFAMASNPIEGLTQKQENILFGTKEHVKTIAKARGYDLKKIDIDYQYSDTKKPGWKERVE